MQGYRKFQIKPELNAGDSKPSEIAEKDSIGQEPMHAMHKGRHPPSENMESSYAEHAGDDHQRQTVYGRRTRRQNHQRHPDKAHQRGDQPMRRLGIPLDHQYQDVARIGPARAQREPVAESLYNAAKQDQETGQVSPVKKEAGPRSPSPRWEPSPPLPDAGDYGARH